MKKALIFAAAVFASGAAHAAGIGIRAGTTGIGAEVAFGVLPTLSARVGYSALKWSYDTDTPNVTYNGHLKLSNANGFLDFHPFGPLFRLTGGVILNSNKYEATGRPTGGLPGSFTATVEPSRRAAPYLGIGWGNVSGTGVNFYSDLGVMFMGSPKATLNADCSGLNGAQCAALQSQAAAEQSRLEDQLKRFKAYPVFNVGFTIGF
jgi:hypothetical protein